MCESEKKNYTYGFVRLNEEGAFRSFTEHTGFTLFASHCLLVIFPINLQSHLHTLSLDVSTCFLPTSLSFCHSILPSHVALSPVSYWFDPVVSPNAQPGWASLWCSEMSGTFGKTRLESSERSVCPRLPPPSNHLPLTPLFLFLFHFFPSLSICPPPSLSLCGFLSSRYYTFPPLSVLLILSSAGFPKPY